MPSKAFDPTIRVNLGTIIDLRFKQEIRVTTADLIAMLMVLDGIDREEARAAIDMKRAVEGPWPSEADLRAKCGITSGPALRAMFRRLEALEIPRPDGEGYLRTFAKIEHHPAPGRGRKGFVIPHVAPTFAHAGAFDPESPWMRIDARCLHGLALPSAVLLLKYLGCHQYGLQSADRALKGRVRVFRGGGPSGSR